MCKQGWQTGSSLSQRRLRGLHQGWAFIIINYSGRPRKGGEVCAVGGEAQAPLFVCRTGSSLIGFGPATQRGRTGGSEPGGSL